MVRQKLINRRLSIQGTANRWSKWHKWITELARTLLLSKNDSHLYVLGYGDNAVSWFERNSSTGELTSGGLIENGQNGVDGINGPGSIVLSDNGDFAYITGLSQNSVAWFGRNQTSGALNYLGKLNDNTHGVDGLGEPHDIALTKNGLLPILSRVLMTQ